MTLPAFSNFSRNLNSQLSWKLLLSDFGQILRPFCTSYPKYSASVYFKVSKLQLPSWNVAEIENVDWIKNTIKSFQAWVRPWSFCLVHCKIKGGLRKVKFGAFFTYWPGTGIQKDRSFDGWYWDIQYDLWPLSSRPLLPSNISMSAFCLSFNFWIFSFLILKSVHK